MVSETDVGQPIAYWKNGWYSGVLLRIEKSTAVVRHPVLKREQKIPVADCKAHQGEAKLTIFDCLFKAAQTCGFKKQEPSESDQEYLASLVRSIASVDETTWKKLPVPAQEWFNSAVGQVSSMQLISNCPGFLGLDATKKTTETQTPPKGLTATEVLTNKPAVIPTFPTNKPKRKITGFMDALRRTVIIHPEWTSRQVYDYLKLNGFPDAKLDTISVDGGNIRRVIDIARELGLWKDKQEEIKQSA